MNKSKKHIVIDARRLRQTTGRYTRNMLDQLQRIDTENHYTVLVTEEDEAWWNPTSPRFTRLRVSEDHYTFGEQTMLAYKLYKLKADLVHFAMPQQPLLYRGPSVTTIHDLTLLRFKNVKKSAIIYNIKQAIFAQVLTRVARRSLKILTITQFSKNDIATYCDVPPDKIVVTYPSAEKITEPSETISELQGQKFIMYAGNAHVHKNLDRLLDAFVLMKKLEPSLKLVLVGNTDIHYRRLEERTHDESIEDVHFMGFMSEGQLRWLYEHANAYIFPSLNEGFGLPGLEAMHYDLPLISSNASCLPEVYGDAAHYFDPLDPQAIAHATLEVLQNTELQQQLVTAGEKQRAKYSWEKMGKEIHKGYMEALAFGKR